MFWTPKKINALRLFVYYHKDLRLQYTFSVIIEEPILFREIHNNHDPRMIDCMCKESYIWKQHNSFRYVKIEHRRSSFVYFGNTWH